MEKYTKKLKDYGFDYYNIIDKFKNNELELELEESDSEFEEYDTRLRPSSTLFIGSYEMSVRERSSSVQ